MQKNEIYRAVVSGFTSEGLGVCRVDGCAVFVPNAVPGEEYDLRITHVGSHGAYGKIETIITKSPHRVNRLCPYAKQCGGCDFWHMDYEAECEIKARRVLDALNRLGGQNLSQIELTGAKTCVSYRNKAQFPVAPGKKGPEAGFFRKGTHDLIPMERCLIQPEAADKARDIVIAWARQYGVSAYDEKTHTGLLRHIFVRHAAATGELMVCPVVNGETLPREKELVAALRKGLPELRSVALNVNTRKGNAVLGEKTRILWGTDAIEDILCGLRFRISPRSFYQVNRDQAEVLYGKALAAAGLHGTETVLDLYCGTGTITLCLARQAKAVIGVELVEAAIRDAEENARRNGIENARFFCADAGKAAKTLAAEGTRPDVIVVDPPRKGLSADVIDAVEEMSPDRVVYVSCDPATLARDVKLFGEKGYRLQSAEAVDLFPRCSHVECVVKLCRESKVIKSLETGYINKNNQKNMGCKGKSETHYNQKAFEMKCLDCGHTYLANGCDVWLRKCPVCQPKTNKRRNPSARTVSDKLRYQVLKRDNFKCCACGASPAKNPSVELHIDHIVPWSKGGKTTIDNLQTLCSKCNSGKSDDL